MNLIPGFDNYLEREREAREKSQKELSEEDEEDEGC